MAAKVTYDEILRRFINTHGTKYTYEKSTYIGTNKVMSMSCLEHGEFSQRPIDHYSGQGCPKCGEINRRKTQTSDKTTFITKANVVHGNRYSYPNAVYTKSRDPILITCAIHGDFTQTPNKHLMGQGCALCNKPQKKTTSSFIEEAKEVHGNKYSYDNVVYSGIEKPVSIICPTHGEFAQTPYHHLKGSQCSQCSSYGFKRELPALLYYLRITTLNGIFYKIGITNRTVEERFTKGELKCITVVRVTPYTKGQEAFTEEQKIRSKFLDYLYDGPALLHNGNTEIFTKDVLELDTI